MTGNVTVFLSYKPIRFREGGTHAQQGLDLVSVSELIRFFAPTRIGQKSAHAKGPNKMESE